MHPLYIAVLADGHRRELEGDARAHRLAARRRRAWLGDRRRAA